MTYERAIVRPAFPRLRRLVLPALLLSLLGVSPAASADDGAAVAEHLRAAEELREEGRLRKARRELERADRTAGGASSKVAAALGRLALAENDPETALTEARRALDLAADDAERAEAWLVAGLVRLDLARAHEVTAELDRAARHQRRAGRPEEADRAHDAAAQELTRAEEAFRHALDLAPSHSAHVHLARIHFQRGDLAEARAELARAGAEGEAEDAGDRLRDCLGALEEQDALYDPASGVAGLEPPKKLEADRPSFDGLPPNGFVVIRSVIDISGGVVCARNLASSDARIADAALEAVRSWRFEPATRDGEPVPMTYYVSINFLRN